MTFGQRLTQARKAKGLTQEGLGKGLGTDGTDASKSVVYGWEKDQHFPRVDQLVLICKKLGCSADFLLFGKVESAELPPEVHSYAAALSQLPPAQRQWLADAVKFSTDAALHVAHMAAQQVAVGQEVTPSAPSKRMSGAG